MPLSGSVGSPGTTDIVGWLLEDGALPEFLDPTLSWALAVRVTLFR